MARENLLQGADGFLGMSVKQVRMMRDLLSFCCSACFLGCCCVYAIVFVCLPPRANDDALNRGSIFRAHSAFDAFDACKGVFAPYWPHVCLSTLPPSAWLLGCVDDALSRTRFASQCGQDTVGVTSMWASLQQYEQYAVGAEARRHHLPAGVMQFIPRKGEGFPEDFVPVRADTRADPDVSGK